MCGASIAIGLAASRAARSCASEPQRWKCTGKCSNTSEREREREKERERHSFLEATDHVTGKVTWPMERTGHFTKCRS